MISLDGVRVEQCTVVVVPSVADFVDKLIGRYSHRLERIAVLSSISLEGDTSRILKNNRAF